MIENYSRYIDSYIATDIVPGEHHFVASYLLPRVFSISDEVPGYVNPDGMKGASGDLVSALGSDTKYSIEVKLRTIRLTAREFNDWVFEPIHSVVPTVFVGIGKKGIAVCSWQDFVHGYKESITKPSNKRQAWPTEKKKSGEYGPMKEVDVLLDDLPSEYVFRYVSDEKEAIELDSVFCAKLSELIGYGCSV